MSMAVRSFTTPEMTVTVTERRVPRASMATMHREGYSMVEGRQPYWIKVIENEETRVVQYRRAGNVEKVVVMEYRAA